MGLLSILTSALVGAYLFCCTAITDRVPFASFHPAHIITRDVCIIGGGSSGTFSAIQLHDLGKSVVIVERSDCLGGHTDTYTDPTTNVTVDYGVIVFHNLTLVKNYFARLNVSLAIHTGDSIVSKFADFHTGQLVPYPRANLTQGLTAWATQLARFPSIQEGFFLPDPVPEDLLLPFGEFASKYGIDGAVQTIYEIAQGYGDVSSQPTLYIMKVFGADILSSVINGFLTTTRQNNQALYTAALSLLGPNVNVLLSSTVIHTKRLPNNHTDLIVQTSTSYKLIRAKTVLITIPPLLSNLAAFDLDPTECGLFSQFQNSAYYTSLVHHPTLPSNQSFYNLDPSASFSLPVLPGPYSFIPTAVPGLINVKYGSPSILPDANVQADILASLSRLAQAGTIPTPLTSPEFVRFKAHTSFALMVSVKAIKEGFYRDLYALQGRHGTFWTGGTWQTADSSLIWNFTAEHVLPLVEAALK
jgi:NAD(P)-binding Rossmann-like domain